MLAPRLLRGGENYLHFINNDGVIGITRRARPLSTTHPGDSAHLVKMFARIDAAELSSGKTIAHIGGGMGWLAKMLLGYGLKQTIYEIEPEIIDFLKEGPLGERSTRFIQGDWKQTLIGKYDVIAYDIIEPVDEVRIRHHLNDGGLFLQPSD